MSTGDIKILAQASYAGKGARKYNTASGTTINPGEPVVRTLGAVAVTAMGSGVSGVAGPQVGTDYVVGISATTSRDTTTAAGYVYVYPLSSQTTYLIAANDATAWNLQSEYDALVGKRLVIDYTAGKYTILSTDDQYSGCVVVALDVSRYPGKVAFAFREGLSDLS